MSATNDPSAAAPQESVPTSPTIGETSADIGSLADRETGAPPAAPESIPLPPPAPPRPRTTPGQLAAEIARLDRALAVVVLVFAFLLGSFAARNSDLWMRLASGRLIANFEYTFGTDPFSYATADRYWVNHDWLYDLFIY